MNPPQPHEPVEALAVEIIAWIDQDREREGLPAQVLTADTPLLEEEVFDSIKVLELVAWLESTYGVTLGVEQMTPATFASARVLATQVHQLRSAGSDQAS